MHILKKYQLLFIIVIVTAALVLFKALTNSGFKSDAGKWAAASFSGENIISREQLKDLSGNILAIDLSENGGNIAKLPEGAVSFPPKSVMDDRIRRMIHQHNGPVVLYADDLAVSAKIWMLLSQTGQTQLYVLTDSMDNETIKYKFRPDTLIKPEL